MPGTRPATGKNGQDAAVNETIHRNGHRRVALGSLSLVRACATPIAFCGTALVLLLGESAFGADATVNGPSELLFRGEANRGCHR